ncbi:MAG: TatD family hydrolase [Candidatus Doudnabacteria bacterium]|nr:TatD family hydrolase [Candidatus Doudnabacteria bacterium]
MLIDTHAHVQFSGFKDEADEIMQRALDAGMVVVNVGSQIDTSTEAVKMLDKFAERVYAVVGLHPEHTFKHTLDEEESHFETRQEDFNYEAYKALAQNPKVVGIGECGLDYFRFEEGSDIVKIKEQQRLAFDQQIKLALELDKALVVHCRPSSGTVDAYEDLVEILTRVKQENSQLRFEVHCFTGTLAVAQKFVELGGYLGLNGIITFDKTGTSEEVVKNISLDNIILETDCPYLSPVPLRGKRNEPLNVKYVAEKIAEWKNVSFEEVEIKTTENAKQLFKLEL